MKSFRKPNSIVSKAAITCVLAATIVLGTAIKLPAQIIYEYDQGWINSDNVNNGGIINENTYTGVEPTGDSDAGTYDSYFEFNLSSIEPHTVTGATLTFNTVYNAFTGTATFSLYNIGSAPSGISTFSGLTSGDLIGQATVTSAVQYSDTPSLTVTLNSLGITDLNSAAGGQLYIIGAFSGGTATTTNEDGFRPDDAGTANLDLTESAAPEPSTWTALAGGIATLAFLQRRKLTVKFAACKNRVL